MSWALDRAFAEPAEKGEDASNPAGGNGRAWKRFLFGNGKQIQISAFQSLTQNPFQSLFIQMKQNLGQNETKDI